MSRDRFSRLNAETRALLLRCATEEFAEKGYDAASLNRILERAEMGKSSFYYYFENKADLFETLLEVTLADLFERAGSFDLDSLDSAGFWSGCEAFYARCIAAVSHAPQALKLGSIFYQTRAAGVHSEAIEPMITQARDWVAGFVVRGQALGVIRADLPEPLLIDIMMGVGEALDRWFVANWDGMDDAARNRMAAEHIGLFRRLLEP
ncbi:TetR/AcrR family transcriptional regulator [Pseudoruegeria sp. HB172150]|uniref:TetR/AcrR family transcriptional regulator n=1 Tax=Pseudoruegeria sp. HB172150 TaxID=2721164 RepID=UPI0015576AE1|nr:TetR/AcrR family transcriptional regulator [Pseudoruegeria sp. HB172150]